MGNKVTTHLPEGGTEVVDTRDLEEARVEAIVRLGFKFADLVSQGRNYAGANYQIDDASRANVSGASAMALAVQASDGSWPDGFAWIASDNSRTPLSASQMITFGLDIGAYYTALIVNNRALKDQIALLESNEACDAFDMTEGWPTN